MMKNSKLKFSEYRISANSFRGNYSFLNLTLCSVTFGHSTYRCGNYSREETIEGRKLFVEIRYITFHTQNQKSKSKLIFLYITRSEDRCIHARRYLSILPSFSRASILFKTLRHVIIWIQSNLVRNHFYITYGCFEAF